MESKGRSSPEHVRVAKKDEDTCIYDLHFYTLHGEDTHGDDTHGEATRPSSRSTRLHDAAHRDYDVHASSLPCGSASQQCTAVASCKENCQLTAVLSDTSPETFELFRRCRRGASIQVTLAELGALQANGLIAGASESLRNLRKAVRSIDKPLLEQSPAYVDSLTEVGNRRLGELRLCQALETLAIREASPRAGALLFLDVDHFKAVNDNYGHLAGDEVLKRVAAVLRNTLRGNDLVCRWGGEEFLVLLNGVDRTAALDVAERCRRLVGSAPCQYEGHAIAVTCSIGAAQFRDGDTPHTLLKRADSCMYRAKRLGRNRVCHDEEFDAQPDAMHDRSLRNTGQGRTAGQGRTTRQPHESGVLSLKLLP